MDQGPSALVEDRSSGAGGPNANVVYPLADANGDVVVRNLDPALEYDFLAMVVNMPGWSCPAYTDPGTGLKYWFPPAPTDTPFDHGVKGTPRALDGRTFSISDDC